MENPWLFITRFGDSAVLLPLAAVFTLALWHYQSPRAAWSFGGAMLCCMVALLLLKLLFLSYGHTWYERLESPSGHAGLSVMVYGSLGLVLLSHLSSRGSQIGFATAAFAAAALVLGIALSRKALGVHSVAEVALGCLIGTGSLYFFWRGWRGLAHAPMPLWPVYGALALLAFTLHETTFSPETQIKRVASKIKQQIRALDATPKVSLPVEAPGMLRRHIEAPEAAGPQEKQWLGPKF